MEGSEDFDSRIQRPMTIKQFLEITKDEENNKALHKDVQIPSIEIVGFIQDLRTIQGGIVFDLFDGTDVCESIYWLSPNTENVSFEDLDFIKAVGHYTVNADKKIFRINRIWRETDINYLTTHFLLCVVATKFLESSCNESKNEDFDSIEKEIIRFIKKNMKSDGGVKKTVVIENLGKKFGKENVDISFEKLVDDMFVFCVNDDGYRVTE